MNTVLCIADERGTVPLIPVLKALKKNGTRTIVILSAPSPEEVLLKEEIQSMADQVIIHTQDGSCAIRKGLSQVVAQALHTFPVEEVIVMGSARSIGDSLKSTVNSNIPSQAVLYAGNAVMKGIHGIFRVSICGNVRSVCVDGYDFNAYYATFDELIRKFESSNCQENEHEKKEVSLTQGKLSKHSLLG